MIQIPPGYRGKLTRHCTPVVSAVANGPIAVGAVRWILHTNCELGSLGVVSPVMAHGMDLFNVGIHPGGGLGVEVWWGRGKFAVS